MSLLLHLLCTIREGIPPFGVCVCVGLFLVYTSKGENVAVGLVCSAGLPNVKSRSLSNAHHCIITFAQVLKNSCSCERI